MNLLVVSTWWPCPPDNGSRVRAYELLRQLARRHRVTLLAFGRGGGEPEQWAPLEALCDAVHLVPHPFVARGVLGRRGLLSRVPRHFVQTESPAMRALVAQQCPRHDLALAFQIDAARYVAAAAGIPKVFDEVEVTVPRERAATAPSVSARVRHGLTWAKHRRFVRDVLDRFDAATVVSDSERRALVAIGCDAGRIGIVPNGVTVGPLRPRALDSNVLIYPGSVTYSANLDAVRFFVRDVLPLVQRARPATTLWVTGEIGDVDVTDLRVPGVTFTGFVPEVEPILLQSAACVVPLRIGGGTRLKVLHAMATGTPVVSTSKGLEGLDVDARHCRLADGAEAFAEQVLWVMGNREGAASLAAAARARVEAQYQWPAIGHALERVLDLANARSGAGSSPIPRRVHGGA